MINKMKGSGQINNPELFNELNPDELKRLVPKMRAQVMRYGDVRCIFLLLLFLRDHHGHSAKSTPSPRAQYPTPGVFFFVVPGFASSPV